MWRLRLLPLLLLTSLPVAAQPPHGVSPGGQAITDAVFVRPLYGGPYRHCGGECLKSGTLSWFCTEQQQCRLNCAIAPPSMKCATP